MKKVKTILEKLTFNFANRNYDQCLLLINKILKIDPLNRQAILLLARINIVRDHFNTAEQLLENLLSNGFDNDAFNDLITLKWNQNKYEDAYTLYRNNINSLEDIDPNIITTVILLLIKLEQYEGLVPFIQDRSNLSDREKKSIINILYEQGRLREAIEIAEYINRHESQLDIDFLHLTGNIYEASGQYSKAIELYNKALSMSSDDSILISKAVAQKHEKQEINALESLDKITNDQIVHQKNYHKSLIYLERGELKKGFELYEARLNIREQERLNYFNQIITKKDFNIIKKDIDNILILNEQGVGDFLFFSRYFRFLDEYKNVTIEVDKRLAEIFSENYPKINFIPRSLINANDYNHIIFIGSLPYLTSSYDFITPKKLKVNSDSFNEDIISISWRSFQKGIGKFKSIELSQLSSLINSSSYKAVSVQYGDVTNEILNYNSSENNKRIEIYENINLNNDLLSVFKIIDSSKYIITTCNITAHISGNLGKETYLLAPYHKGKIWYWHSNTIKNLWYPSIKIFENTINGKWDEAITKIEKELD
jgi:tetratricopeptide (TPR) repeat protein